MMSKDNTGGPAFPHNMPPDNPFGEYGMTLRDWFAGQAVSGFAATLLEAPNPDWQLMAQDAYALADAMQRRTDQGGEQR